jgi:hypothetical protein
MCSLPGFRRGVCQRCSERRRCAWSTERDKDRDRQTESEARERERERERDRDRGTNTEKGDPAEEHILCKRTHSTDKGDPAG